MARRVHLIKTIRRQEALPHTKAEESMMQVCKAVRDMLRRGESVRLPGLGTLYVRYLPPRTLRNNLTKRPQALPARAHVRFRPSHNLQTEVTAELCGE